MARAYQRLAVASRALFEDSGFVAVDDDARAEAETDRTGEDGLLEFAVFPDEVFDGFAVGDADDVLIDDGALVEFGGDTVSGGADVFDAAFVGLVV